MCVKHEPGTSSIFLISNRIFFFILLITPSLFLVIVIIPQEALAKTSITTINNNMLTYENPRYGIKIQYPSDWQKVELQEEGSETDHDKHIVEFRSPLQNQSANEDRAVLRISIHQLPSQSNIMLGLLTLFDKTATKKISLDAFVLSHLTFLLMKLIGFHFIKAESGATTLADNIPGHKIVYNYEAGQKDVMKVMEVLTIHDDKGFIIGYIAKESKYSVNLPSIQKILKTFEVK